MARQPQLRRAARALAVVEVGVRSRRDDVQLLRRGGGLVDRDRALVGRGEPLVLRDDERDRHADLLRRLHRRRHRVERRQQHHRLDPRVLRRGEEEAAGADGVAEGADVREVDLLVELAGRPLVLALHVRHRHRQVVGEAQVVHRRHLGRDDDVPPRGEVLQRRHVRVGLRRVAVAEDDQRVRRARAVLRRLPPELQRRVDDHALELEAGRRLHEQFAPPHSHRSRLTVIGQCGARARGERAQRHCAAASRARGAHS